MEKKGRGWEERKGGEERGIGNVEQERERERKDMHENEERGGRQEEITE